MPISQRLPLYPVCSQSQENCRELIIEHVPPWRHGLGLHRIISGERRSERKQKMFSIPGNK